MNSLWTIFWIGLRAFGQKDPLLEYKRESFSMFKQLLDMINREVVTTVWKSVPEIQAKNDNLQQAQQQKSRFDTSRMQASKTDSTGMGMNMPIQEQQKNPMGPNVKAKPVVVADAPGRNDTVAIQNMNTGEVKELKWKHAQKMVDEQGWILVEK